MSCATSPAVVTTGDVRAPRADPQQEDPDRRPGQGDPAPRKGPPRRRREAHLGGIDGVEQILASDDRSDDRRRAGLGGLGGLGRGAHARQDRTARNRPRGELRASPRALVPSDHRPPRLLGRLHRHPQRRDLRPARPFEPQVVILSSIPGISTTTAEIIVAESGADMSRSQRRCTWAPGLGWPRPAMSPPARSVRRGRARRTVAQANPARGGPRRGTHQGQLLLGAPRIARRRGPNKAAVAVAHSMLEPAWHLLSTGALYEDPVPTTSSAVTILASRHSGSSAGSRPSGSPSPSPRRPRSHTSRQLHLVTYGPCLVLRTHGLLTLWYFTGGYVSPFWTS